MALYLVTLDNAGVCGLTKIGGHDACLVSAESEAEAKQMAHAQNDSDGNSWLINSTAVALAPAADWEGWTFRIEVAAPTPIVVSYTAVADDLAADIGAALVAALNAHPDIAGAAYSAPTLTVSDIDDALGDLTLRAFVFPPGKSDSVSALVGDIVDGGIAGAVLEVDLNLDNSNIPTYHRALTQ